jgi:parvulin-like peptidyl-prolyl isomerase
MTEVYPQTSPQEMQTIQPSEAEKATDEAIFNYLRYSCKMAEISALAEQDAKVIKACETLGIVVSDEELQAAGDEFRLKYKLLGASETLAWLEHQRISAEDWTQGIRVRMLTQRLKEHLFADAIDSHYLSNRDEYHRAALSQIIVSEMSKALHIVQTLKAGKESFSAIALEHSKAQPSGKQGGFVGVRFLSTLMPEIREAVIGSKEGEIIDPIKTRLGYHVIRIEKLFPPVLSESVREEILEIFFQAWVNAPDKFLKPD